MCFYTLILNFQTELIQAYGYPYEKHKVITEDGFILEIHRIPFGRFGLISNNTNKPVVFVQHGLLSSSADWVDNGINSLGKNDATSSHCSVRGFSMIR